MMADIKRKVPNLRFKGFTDDWDQRKLGDLFVYNRPDKYMVQDTNYIDSGTPVLTANKSFVLGYTNENHTYNKLPAIIFDDFTLENKFVKFPFMVKSSAIKILNSRNDQPMMFMYQLLQHSRFVHEGHSRHYISIVQRKDVMVPDNVEEQKKIATLFSRIQNIITLQQRKLDLLKQLKKGFLQKMFADKGSKRPILRFEGFNDDWEGRKLENSADYIRGSFPQPYGNKEWYGGTNAKPFVQVVDVNTNMRLNKKTKEQISVLAQPKSRFVPSDSIVVTLQGSIGRVAITQYDSYVDRTLLIFTKYKVPVDKYFWAYSIQNIFRIEKQKAPGGTIKTITKRALSSFEVSLPVQEEQKKIGTLLKNIDDIITSQQEEVSKLKKIKKSLLQQMFI